MIRLARDTWLALLLIAVLLVVTVGAAVAQTRLQEAPALASTSSQPDGARALRMWLDQLGFITRTDVGASFQIPADTDLVWVLEPSESISEAEWKDIDGWVEKGGRLVFAGEGLYSLLGMQHYQFELRYQAASEALAPQTPLMTSPPLDKPIPAQARAYLQSERTDFVAHLASEQGPVLVSFRLGQGQVFLSAAPFSLTNAGLKLAGNPELALNLAAQAVHQGQLYRGRAWFDEWHHGLRQGLDQIRGPDQWLRGTPAGQALLYLAGVAFLALVLGGRNFGRPLSPSNGGSRRSPVEYITAIANLSRRAGQRRAVLQHYRLHLKRSLGRRYRINPTLGDGEFVQLLAQVRPEIDRQALADLLQQLNQAAPGESETVQLAREAAQWIENH